MTSIVQYHELPQLAFIFFVLEILLKKKMEGFELTEHKKTSRFLQTL